MAFSGQSLCPKNDLLLQSNPVNKKIPVLPHHDKPICESGIIVEYIDEVWPSGPSILPVIAYDRAIARFWAAYIDDKWFLCIRNILGAEDDESKKPYFEQMEEVLERMEDVFNNCSKGKAFFGGEQIGFVDIVFGSFFSWLSVIENMNGWKLLVEAKAPALVKWAGRFAADPAVKGVIPETDKLIEFAKAVQPQRIAASAK